MSDTVEGGGKGLGFEMCAKPECLMKGGDGRRRRVQQLLASHVRMKDNGCRNLRRRLEGRVLGRKGARSSACGTKRAGVHAERTPMTVDNLAGGGRPEAACICLVASDLCVLCLIGMAISCHMAARRRGRDEELTSAYWLHTCECAAVKARTGVARAQLGCGVSSCLTHLCGCCLPGTDVSCHIAATSPSSPTTGSHSTSRGPELATPPPPTPPPPSAVHRVPLPSPPPAHVPPPPLCIPTPGSPASLPPTGTSPRPVSQPRGASKSVGKKPRGPSSEKVDASMRPSMDASIRPSVDACTCPLVDASICTCVNASKRPLVDTSTRCSVDASTPPSCSMSLSSRASAAERIAWHNCGGEGG
jgi:hypothetical protein